MQVTGGQVVMTPSGRTPYKVVFRHAETGDTEQAVASVRDGEALIRSYMPEASDAPSEGERREAPWIFSKAP